MPEIRITAPRARKSPALDEFLWRPDRALRAGRRKARELDFARSALGPSKHPRWSPSGEQIVTIRHLIAGLAEPAESLINVGVDSDWAT